MTGLDWTRFRGRMPVTRRWAYLDHAAVAPLSLPASDRLTQWCREAREEGDTAWPGWHRGIQNTRCRAAELVNADPSEIALIPSTTAGIGLVAEGFPWRSGDNLVTLENEFPSNLYPWLNLSDRGVETRRVSVDRGRVDLSRIAAACDARTRLIAASWIGYASGWRLDVAELAQLAHERGALLMLDAIQGLGVFPLDVRATDVDFFAADGHKWMLGPEGAGIFFLKREHLDRLRPIGVGWQSVRQAYNFADVGLDLRPEASRYEGGSHNSAGFLALGASLELLTEFGAGPRSMVLADRVLELADQACERLRARGAELLYERTPTCRSGIVTFRWPGCEPDQARQVCAAAGVALSCRGGGIRISPHGYNDSEDLERLLDALRVVQGNST